jgi:hypothetical protein
MKFKNIRFGGLSWKSFFEDIDTNSYDFLFCYKNEKYYNGYKNFIKIRFEEGFCYLQELKKEEMSFDIYHKIHPGCTEYELYGREILFENLRIDHTLIEKYNTYLLNGSNTEYLLNAPKSIKVVNYFHHLDLFYLLQRSNIKLDVDKIWLLYREIELNSQDEHERFLLAVLCIFFDFSVSISKNILKYTCDSNYLCLMNSVAYRKLETRIDTFSFDFIYDREQSNFCIFVEDHRIAYLKNFDDKYTYNFTYKDGILKSMDHQYLAPYKGRFILNTDFIDTVHSKEYRIAELSPTMFNPKPFLKNSQFNTYEHSRIERAFSNVSNNAFLEFNINILDKIIKPTDSKILGYMKHYIFRSMNINSTIFNRIFSFLEYDYCYLNLLSELTLDKDFDFRKIPLNKSITIDNLRRFFPKIPIIFVEWFDIPFRNNPYRWCNSLYVGKGEKLYIFIKNGNIKWSTGYHYLSEQYYNDTGNFLKTELHSNWSNVNWLEEVSDSDESFNDDVSSFFQLPTKVNSEIFYSFLIDTKKSIYENTEMCVKFWDHIHSMFCNHIILLSEDNKIPSFELISAYLKCRHNHFSFVILSMLGIITPLETDADLKNYGIEQTPDFFGEINGSTFLLEFTVGRNRDRIEYKKSSRNMEDKYTKTFEILKISHPELKYFLIPLILSKYEENNIEEILYSIGYRGDFKYLHNFFDICNKKYNCFSHLLFLGNSKVYIPHKDSEAVFKKTLDQLEGTHARPKLSKILKLPSDFFEIIAKCKNNVILYCKKIINSRGRFIFHMDITRNFIKIVEVNEGISIVKVLNFLEDNDFSNIYKFTSLFDKNTPIQKDNFTGYIPLTVETDKYEIDDLIPYIEPPPSKTYLRSSPKFPDKYEKIEYSGDLRDPNLGSVLFPQDYMNTIIKTLDHKKLKCTDKDKHLFINNLMNIQEIDKAREALNNELKEQNITSLPRRIKQSFIYPIITDELRYSEEVDKNFLRNAVKKNTYTGTILDKIINNETMNTIDMHSELSTFKEKYRDELAKINSLKKKEAKILGAKFFNRKKHKASEELEILLEREKEINQLRHSMIKQTMNKNKVKDSIKLKNNKKSNLGVSKAEEFKHYGKNKDKDGFGWADERDIIDLDCQMDKLYKILLSNAPLLSSKLINSPSEVGPKFLTDHKKLMLKQYDNYIQDYSTSLLGYTNEFIERLCYTLYKFSINSCNSEVVMFSNLGYENAFLICLGGKKLFKTGRSRPYRLILPFNTEVSLICGTVNWEKFYYNNQSYVICPWSQMHEDILKNGMSIFRSMFSHISNTCIRSCITIKDMKLHHMIPVFLAYHNKRKTEGALHNVRYLIVNQLGDYSTIEGVTKSFAFFNYTTIDAWLKQSILKNFKIFSEKLILFKEYNGSLSESIINSGLINIITAEKINSVQELVDMVYCTYLMVKAPTDKATEQAINLGPVLQDVLDFNKKHGTGTNLMTTSMHCDLLDNDINIYEDDFKYDPKWCQYLGHYAASYIGYKNKGSFCEKWESIMSKPFTSIANSNGLRGFNKTNFFNKKGYEIVYEFLNNLFKFTQKEVEELNVKLKEEDFKDLVDFMNSEIYTLGQFCNEHAFNKALFHIVDKIQRALNREIFCMDLITKAYQNPIEDFLSFVCKFFHNEFISIPSSYRGEKIHSMFYEGGFKQWAKFILKYTLDCRRWGPHAVFQKYIHFIYGMSDILPHSFIQHFIYVAVGMIENKYFVTREYVLNVMKNNESYAEGLKLLEKLDFLPDDASVLKVEFSFVMGIYNYLSSLMHAVNQLAASEIIMKYNIKHYNSLVLMNMIAHSDDSTGESKHEDEITIEPTIILYDYLLKAANHMKSLKKCIIDKNGKYLEMLSILYICDQMLPLISKFWGTIPFVPSDLGYNSDIQFCTSQLNEMISYGSTFSEAYLMSKLTERHIQRFYNIDKIDTNRPSIYFGSYDQHPIEILIGGQDSELFKHLRYNADNLNGYIYILNELNEEKSTLIPKLTMDMGSYLSTDLKDKFPQFKNEILDSWTVLNGKFNNNLLNYVWFINRLYNKNFYSSLISEPSGRRVGRIYGVKNRIIKGTINSVTFYDLFNLLENSIPMENVDLSSHMKYYSTLNSELNLFYNAIDDIDMEQFDIEPSRLTLKPTTIQITDSNLPNIDVPINYYITWLKEKNYLSFYGITKKYDSQCNQITDYLSSMGIDTEKMSPEDLLNMMRKVLIGYNTHIKILSTVNSDNRYITSFESLLGLLETNTIYAKKLIVPKEKVRKFDIYNGALKGMIPKEIFDLLNCRWVLNATLIIRDNNLDIFEIDPSNYYNEIIKNISPSWISLVNSIDLTKPIRFSNYWCCWIKRQQRLGNLYIGEGKLLVKVPENTLIIDVYGNNIKKITVKEENYNIYSTATFSFLKLLVFDTPGFMSCFKNCDNFSPDQKVFGLNEQSFGFGLPSNFKYGCPVILDRAMNHPLLTNDLQISYERNVCSVSISKVKYKIMTFGLEHQKIIDIRKYFSLEKIMSMIDHPEVKNLCEKLSLITKIPVTLNKELAMTNMLSLRIYRILYQNNSRDLSFNNCLVRSLIIFKEENPNFGFPDINTICEINNDDFSLRLPTSLLTALENVGLAAYKPEVKSAIQYEILDALNNPDTYKRNILNAVTSYGQQAIHQGLLNCLNKDLYYIQKLKSFQDYEFGYEAAIFFKLYCAKKKEFNLYNFILEKTNDPDDYLKVIITACMSYVLHNGLDKFEYYEPCKILFSELVGDNELVKNLLVNDDPDYMSWSTVNFPALNYTDYLDMISNIFMQISWIHFNSSTSINKVDPRVTSMFIYPRLVKRGLIGNNGLGKFEIKIKHSKVIKLKKVFEEKPGDIFYHEEPNIIIDDEYKYIPNNSDETEIEELEIQPINQDYTYFYKAFSMINWKIISDVAGSAPYIFLELPILPQWIRKIKRNYKIYKRVKYIKDSGSGNLILAPYNFLLVLLPNKRSKINFDEFDIINSEDYFRNKPTMHFNTMYEDQRKDKITISEAYNYTKTITDTRSQTILNTLDIFEAKNEFLDKEMKDSAEKIKNIVEGNNPSELEEIINDTIKLLSNNENEIKIKNSDQREYKLAEKLMSHRIKNKLFKESRDVLTDEKTIMELNTLLPSWRNILDLDCSLMPTTKRKLFNQSKSSRYIGFSTFIAGVLSSIKDGPDSLALKSELFDLVVEDPGEINIEPMPPNFLEIKPDWGKMFERIP